MAHGFSIGHMVRNVWVFPARPALVDGGTRREGEGKIILVAHLDIGPRLTPFEKKHRDTSVQPTQTWSASLFGFQGLLFIPPFYFSSDRPPTSLPLLPNSLPPRPAIAELKPILYSLTDTRVISITMRTQRRIAQDPQRPRAS